MSAENKRAVTATFAVNLRRLRQARRLTQRELAEKIGVSETTYAAYEFGRKTAGIDKLKAIAEVLEVSVADLLGVDDSGADKQQWRFEHCCTIATILGCNVEVNENDVTVFSDELFAYNVLDRDVFMRRMETLETFALTLARVRQSAREILFDSGGVP